MNRSRRQAKSLIEMLVIMTVLSVIMGTSAATLIMLLRCERQVRRDLDQQHSLARLGNRFRSDAHDASGVQVRDDCRLTLADGRIIRYAAEKTRITREVERGGQIEHRDQFPLPVASAVTFDTPGSEGKLVRVSIVRPEDVPLGIVTSARPTLIEAAVNLHGKEQRP